MAGINDHELGQAQPVPPLARRSAHNSHWLLGTLLFVIAISAIVGIVVTASMGQTTVALIIALFAGAFFSRAGC
jgi:cytochrome b561